MSGQRIALWTVAVVALLAAIGYNVAVFREPPTPTVNIVFITGGSGPYWQRTVNGAKSAADDFDATLSVETPSVAEGVEEQTKLLQDLNAKPVDGIAVSPLDAEGQTPLINQLSKKTFLVTFDSDASDSLRQSHVGTTNYAAGRACARLVRDAIPNGGKIAVLVANSTKENIIDRKGAFKERIAQFADDDVKPGDPLKYTIVGFYEDGGSAEKCAANIREAFKQHPDLACIVGMNAQHGPTILKVLKEDGQLDKVKVVTFDDAPETLQGVAGRAHFRDARAGFIWLRLRGGEDSVQLEAGRRGGGADGRSRAGVLRRRSGQHRTTSTNSASGWPTRAALRKRRRRRRPRRSLLN